MRKQISEKELFEYAPVPKSVAVLAIPTIISQLVTMVYNLADTFFIGQIGNPYMVAAVSLVFPWFNLLTALGNLFGLGASSLISRMLGTKDYDDIKHVSSFSIWGGAFTVFCFSVLSYLFRKPLLVFLGASQDTYHYAESYLLWVVVLGGVPTMVSLVLAHLLRSEGHTKQASAGMMFGGIMNMVLDPLFIFVFDLDVIGAAIATMFSNSLALLFFAYSYGKLKSHSNVSLDPRNFTFGFMRQIFSVGLASALATTLANASNMVIMKLASGYGDIAIAACGIVKKIDQLPINISMGLCQGVMPLIGYNYASGDYKRMHRVSTFSWKVASIMSLCFVSLFCIFSPFILRVFIKDSQTSVLGSAFLRIASLSVPLTSINFLVSYTFQAMGKGLESATLTFSRQGILNIPLLILMNIIFGLYGMIWTQLVVEVLMLPVSLSMYFHVLRKLQRKSSAVADKS